MSAAVRPTSAILRRARHVPVTQCLARRWQTNTAQPQSYEEMLSGLEAEFPDPTKAPSQSNHRNQRPESSRRHDQLTEDAHASSLPAVESFGNQQRTNTGEQSKPQRAPKFRKTSGNNDASVKSPSFRQATTDNTDAQKPRRVPPPTFKPSSEPHIKQQAPEKVTVRRVEHSYAKSDRPGQPVLPRMVTKEESDRLRERFDFSDTPNEILESARKSEKGPKHATKSQEDVDSVGNSTVEPNQKPAEVLQKHVKSINKSTDQLEPTPTSLNPLETASFKLPHKSSLKGAGPPAKYDNIFLRDSCACAQCVDASTRQKRFDSADIPTNISIRSLKYDGEHIIITWKHDVSGFGPDHQTRLSHDFLKRAPKRPVHTAYSGGKWAWTTAEFEAQMVDYDYHDYMSDDKVLFQLIRQLHTFGLVFIKNVPESESGVVDTANRIGPLKNTFYGDTWDVRSVSNAKNVAYTDVHLGFHMDLLYMQQPPRLQLLHCLRASEQGGISLFSDAYKAVDQLHDMDPDAFEALMELPVNFHYDNDNHHYFRRRRTFQLRDGFTKPEKGAKRAFNSLEAVNWAPPFQAPFSHTDGNVALAQNVRQWHTAAQLFRNLTEMKSAVYRRQMAPGECVIFDNRRVLHARTAFAGGERWLRGAYLDDDPYLSKIRVLERTFGEIQNRSWLKSMPGTEQ
ncbi:MAG: Uncharacterized protein AUREO_042550 [Aureobasidium pullulans]|nr:MAG: Uncharacterized protein AUREO_042550 [Aureobasidium pullulans]